MAIMYPKTLASYFPTWSEKIVFNALKEQLPDSFSVFYSVSWSKKHGDKMEKSEADFIVISPDYGYLCLEVKGGSELKVDCDGNWFIKDGQYGERKLSCSPYEQAEKSMYYFKELYAQVNHISFPGTYAAGVVFPFYSIQDIQNMSNRNVECTIDSLDMNNILKKVKDLFKVWGSNAAFGKRIYEKNQHKAFEELIKKSIAISAAAGSLVKYKEEELGIINRVQDNYIFLLSNIKQFYIKGGAGTGKTWIAIKMANESAIKNHRTLLLCSSKPLSKWLADNADQRVEVYNIETLLNNVSYSFESFNPPFFEGISNSLRHDLPRYDAIYIDEAQDFTEEWAYIIKLLLRNEKESRLGIFFDDVQNLMDNEFSDYFMLNTPPFLLRENIRNTSSIYNWAIEKTLLGRNVIANPVEGPTPIKETIRDSKHLMQRLESILKEFIDDEGLESKSLVVLVEDYNEFIAKFGNSLAKWKFIDQLSKNQDPSEIFISSVADFKGLEANMVIYIHNLLTPDNVNYIAYTRAKFYLHELVMK